MRFNKGMTIQKFSQKVFNDDMKTLNIIMTQDALNGIILCPVYRYRFAKTAMKRWNIPEFLRSEILDAVKFARGIK